MNPLVSARSVSDAVIHESRLPGLPRCARRDEGNCCVSLAETGLRGLGQNGLNVGGEDVNVCAWIGGYIVP
jgi:hypothetical protein